MRLLDFELRTLELSQHPRGALDGMAAGLLQPVPHCIAALIVDDSAGLLLRLPGIRVPSRGRSGHGSGPRRGWSAFRGSTEVEFRIFHKEPAPASQTGG